MSASSRAPPSEMRTYFRPIARAIDLATEVLPTPGGPTNSRIGPRARSSSLPGTGTLGGGTVAVAAGVSADSPRRPPRSSRLGRGRSACLVLGPKLPHGEELEHAVLHVAQGVVVLVEDPLRLGQIEVLRAARVPGQLDDVLEEGPDDLGLHRLAPDPRQPAELAVHFLPHFGGELERGELLLQVAQIVALVVLAQLALDRLELLAEEHLPLPLAQLLLDLRLDVFLRVQHADLPLDVHQHPAEPLLDAQGLQQHLPLLRRDVDVAGDQVGELAGLVHAGQDLLDHLVGQAGLLAQLRGAGAGLAVQGDEGRILRVEGCHLLGLAHDGLEVAVLVGVVDGDAAPLAVEQQLHAGQPALELADPGDGPDGVEHLGSHAFDVLPLGDREHQPLGLAQRALDGAKRRGPPRADRRGDPGEQHDLAKRQHRQCQTFGHLSITPSNPN